jgi:osmotically inducible protein OsmC
MPAARKGEAVWEGSLQDGQGTVKVGNLFEGPYTFSSRFEEGKGTNPEELIAAAHAGCFSMFLAGSLGRAGHNPNQIQTTAELHLDKGDEGWRIKRVDLHTAAEVEGIDEDTFRQQVEASKENCPVSKALAGVEITVDARLLQ